MKTLILTCVATIVMMGSALANPASPQSATAPGDVEIVTKDGHQFVKFGTNFSVESQAECEVQHVDGQTGKVTTIGQLISRKGYQVYEVPDGLVINRGDRIVIYSPLMADDLATVELSDIK